MPDAVPDVQADEFFLERRVPRFRRSIVEALTGQWITPTILAGLSYDNAAAESLNSLYKRELIDFEKGWEGVGDVMIATMEWVSWYNEERIHSYSGDMAPKRSEELYYKALESGKLTISSQT